MRIREPRTSAHLDSQVILLQMNNWTNARTKDGKQEWKSERTNEMSMLDLTSERTIELTN